MIDEVTKRLIKLTSEGSSATREAALYALGEGAAQTEEVINTLLKATSEGGTGTREAAIRALGRIYRSRK
ncbi:HEAT repeat domain-containing protein [Rahnella victoriana]|uniref:HEAT repeat domain-containing protein n=1 Tax=Rahnella victoriana TaxID=1510570 RepID=A0ABS0DQH6_9GAMM|nr:HEAT repeat domain-containing protein [Rahnella victoriana]MBF7956141.1 HEAT repeat domain-containing protein [Rahnella victoriana]